MTERTLRDEAGETLDRACGRFLVVRGLEHTLTRRLPKGGALALGRAEDADVQIVDVLASRVHARLQLGPEVTIEDLGSTNGTRLRDEIIPPFRPMPVQPGDAIAIGSTLLVVQRQEPPMAAQVAAVPEGSAMQRLYAVARKVAGSTINVLIVGETGAGKEVLARAIHDASPRADHPLVCLNCAALSDSLLEGELFGYEKGAFTGAFHAKPGLLEAAASGTLFLDEIGEMSLVIQAKILRALESREVLRLGATRPRPVDVRFLAATNRNLEEAVAAKTFREDLYFRLNGITLAIPPLRERVDEIAFLARLFLERAARSIGRRPPLLAPEVVARLQSHTWPGNIRELRNVMERALVLAASGRITLDHLPLEAMARPLEPQAAVTAAVDRPPTTMAEIERRSILEALERCAGNQTRAAELLGMPRRTFCKRLRAYNVARPLMNRR